MSSQPVIRRARRQIDCLCGKIVLRWPCALAASIVRASSGKPVAWCAQEMNKCTRHKIQADSMLAPLTIALTAAALASTSSQAYQLPLRLTPSSWQAATSTNAAASAGNYTSHALLRLTPPSSTVSSLKHAAQELGLDVWRASAASCSRSNSTAGQGCLELRFPPLLASLRQDACSALRSIMPEVENCQVLLPDIGAVVEQQRAEGEAKALLRRKRRSEAEEEEPEEFFDDYRPIEE